MNGYITKDQALKIFHGKWRKQIQDSDKEVYSDAEIFEMQRKVHAEPICCKKYISNCDQCDDVEDEYGNIM
jgi:hypothetical protein